MSFGGWNPFATTAGTYIATLVISLLSGLIPVINIETYLIAAAALAPAAAAWPIVLITTFGQMCAKCVLYHGGKNGLRQRAGRFEAKLQKAEEAFRKHPAGPDMVVLTSAVTGIPPFYGVSVIAGVTRLSLARFLIVATPGRLARFAFCFFGPRLLTGLF